MSKYAASMNDVIATSKRIEGHKEGVRTVKKITKYCAELNIKHLTLYTFSNENWLRPKTEVGSLMKLFVSTLNKELKLLLDNNIRFKVIGDKNKLDFITRKKINDVEYLTERNTGMGMNLAISYGGRQEIITAVINRLIMIADPAPGVCRIKSSKGYTIGLQGSPPTIIPSITSYKKFRVWIKLNNCTGLYLQNRTSIFPIVV